MSRLGRWLGRGDADLRVEIDEHVALETEENLARGMTPDEARRAALRAFGNSDVVRERVREARPVYWLETIGQDLRFGLRQLRRNLVVSGAVILTLAFGIGLDTAVFTVIEHQLFAVPVSDPDSFASLHPVYSGETAERTAERVSYADYREYRAGIRSLAEVAAWNTSPVRIGEDASARVPANQVSCNYFSVYGVRGARLGRLFVEEECSRPGGAAVVLLSEEVWQQRFASDPAVLGTTLLLEGQAFTVIGVAAPPAGEHSAARVWVPYTAASLITTRRDLYADSGVEWLRLSARLEPGRSRADAAAELRVLAAQQDRLHPGRQTTFYVTDGSQYARPGGLDRSFWPIMLVMGSLTLVLVMVCVNASMLLLSRAAARRREIAVRLSLGAGRGRLACMLLTESLILAAAAGAISAWLAYHAPGAMMKLVAAQPGSVEIQPDWRAFVYLAGVVLLAACAAGAAPILESLRVDLSASLKGHEGPVVSARWRTRDLLVSAQVASSVVLLVAAGIVLQATYKYFTLDTGFETSRVLVVPSTMRMPPYTPETARAFLRTLEERVRALPAVESAAFATSIQGGNPEPIERLAGSGRIRSRASVNDVTPDFFRTLGIPIVRGRAFDDRDAVSGKAAATVVSETLARRLWPEGDALGGRIQDQRGQVLEVVGVAADTRSMLFHGADAQFYRPRRPDSDDDDLLVRFTGDAAAVQVGVRRIVREMDHAMTPAPETLRARIEAASRKVRPVRGSVLFLAGTAAMLVVIGIYGVASFAVTQRRRELGIRIALGATRRDVLRVVAAWGTRSLVAGLAVGLPLAVAAGQVLSRTFNNETFRVETDDPAAYAAVALLLVLVAAAAMVGPGRRAAASDPVAALRQD